MQPRYIGRHETLQNTKSTAVPDYGGSNQIVDNIRRRKFVNLFIRVYGSGTDTPNITVYAGNKQAGVAPVMSFGTSGTLAISYTGSEVKMFIPVELHNHDLGLYVSGPSNANLNANVNVEIQVTDSNNM